MAGSSLDNSLSQFLPAETCSPGSHHHARMDDRKVLYCFKYAVFKAIRRSASKACRRIFLFWLPLFSSAVLISIRPFLFVCRKLA